MRVQQVLVAFRRIVLSLAWSTMFRSTTFSSKGLHNSPRAPLGRLATGQCDQIGLGDSVKDEEREQLSPHQVHLCADLFIGRESTPSLRHHRFKVRLRSAL